MEGDIEMKTVCSRHVLITWILACIGCGIAAAQTKPLTPADLMRTKGIEDAQISPDGKELLFIIKEADLAKDQYVRTIWRMPVNGESRPVRLTDSDQDSSPRWSPDGRRVAFLSAREGMPQIWIFDCATGRAERITQAPGSAFSFAWAPDGQKIAFLTSEAKMGAVEQGTRAKNRGVVIKDGEYSVVNLFNNPDMSTMPMMWSVLWMVNVESKQSEPVFADSDVVQFSWSPDGRKLALRVNALPNLSMSHTDILVYSLAEKKSVSILHGSGDAEGNWAKMRLFGNPIWSPDGAKLFATHVNMAKLYASPNPLGIFGFADSKFTLIPGTENWEPYIPKYTWINPDAIYVENTVRASRHLYSITIATGAVKRVEGWENGCDSQFSFSKDGNVMVYVRETAQKPPEIYVSLSPFSTAKPVTSLNSGLLAYSLPVIERIRWNSRDRTEIEGWLIKPLGFREGQKYPLVTVVHGGPQVAVSDEWNLYLDWPYGPKILATRGYLVFIPNYRGSTSYGVEFKDPPDSAKEPVEDVVSGIEYLEGRGLVDPEKIGICGMSYGAWLGPMILTRFPKMFRAASFAEGVTDVLAIYGQLFGWININGHDYYLGLGFTPYAKPQRYLDISPLFHLRDVSAAVMIESGGESLAYQGLEFQGALWRCGIPHEHIVYPKTGHGIFQPVLELESMSRNLDWFDYWMLGKKDPDPSKEAQYRRWEQTSRDMERMRAEHNAFIRGPHHEKAPEPK